MRKYFSRTTRAMRVSGVLLAMIAGSYALSAPDPGARCVRIYYDDPAGANDTEGKLDSIFLQNLLGHFPLYQQVIAPVESYKKGQLNECKASFYIGSHFDNQLPQDFLDDFATTERNVMWIGFSIWRLGPERLTQLFGYQYKETTTLDEQHKDPQGRPTFYKIIHYKGEDFLKQGEYSEDHKTFEAPYAMVALNQVNGSSQVLATAEHNFSGNRLPYIIRNKNRFYVADVPFSYMHEADRYLVFADVLFDVLNEPPRYTGKRPASFRIEDVHPCLGQPELRRIGDLAKRESIPFNIALIPIFRNPLNAQYDNCSFTELQVQNSPTFLQLLGELKSKGAHFVWHGVTHQYGNKRNPGSGISGDDYEFWLSPEETPVSEDSANWVLDRLSMGWNSLSLAGVLPKVWEVPHYAASALDYLLFGRVFSWNIGRMIYASVNVSGLPTGDTKALWFETSGTAGDQARKQAFQSLQVSASAPQYAGQYVGQFFPYEIHGDYYGQRVIPENLGYVGSYGTTQHQGNDLPTMLANAKRNLVLRDNWASFYFHSFLLEGNDIKPLEEFIRSIKSLGYEFVDLDRFTQEKTGTLRPEPIYVTNPQPASR